MSEEQSIPTERMALSGEKYKPGALARIAKVLDDGFRGELGRSKRRLTTSGEIVDLPEEMLELAAAIRRLYYPDGDHPSPKDDTHNKPAPAAERKPL